MAGTLPAAGVDDSNPSTVKTGSTDESHSLPDVMTAVYSNVDVWEVILNSESVMRRRADSYVNATHILKLAGFDKSQRTKILENVAATGPHDKVQGGYGKFQGTWVPLERAIQLAEECGVFKNIRNILAADAALLPESAPAPKSTSSKGVKSYKSSNSRRSTATPPQFGLPPPYGADSNLSHTQQPAPVRQSTASLIANYRQKNANYAPQTSLVTDATGRLNQGRRHSIAVPGNDMLFHHTAKPIAKPGRGRKAANSGKSFNFLIKEQVAAAKDIRTGQSPIIGGKHPHPFRRSSMPSCNEFDYISNKSLKSLEMDPLLKAMIDKVYDDGRESEDVEGVDEGLTGTAQNWSEIFAGTVPPLVDNSGSLSASGGFASLAPTNYFAEPLNSGATETVNTVQSEQRPLAHSTCRFGIEAEDFTTEMDESYFNFGQYSLSPSPIPDASHSTAGGTRLPVTYPVPSGEAEHDFLGYLLDPAMELNRSILTALFLRDGGSTGSSSSGSPTPEESLPTSPIVAGQLRLRHGANLNSPIDDDGNTVLHWAVTLGRTDTVKFLRDKKARIDVANSAGETALMRAAYHSACHEHMAFAEMLQILAEKSLLSCDRKGRNLLHHICGIREPYHPSIQALKYYLQTTLDFVRNAHVSRYSRLLNQADEHGDTPLIVAARAGVAYFVKLLLEAGSDPYHRNLAGISVLDFHLGDTLRGMIDKLPKPKKIASANKRVIEECGAPARVASVAQEFAAGKILAPIVSSPDKVAKMLADPKLSQSLAENVQPILEKMNEVSQKVLMEKNEMNLLRQKLIDLQREQQDYELQNGSGADSENVQSLSKKRKAEDLYPSSTEMVVDGETLPRSGTESSPLLQVSVPGNLSSIS